MLLTRTNPQQILWHSFSLYFLNCWILRLSSQQFSRTATSSAAPRAPPRSFIVLKAVATDTLKIGTRGSPLALAQAYMTRDLLKVKAFLYYIFKFLYKFNYFFPYMVACARLLLCVDKYYTVWLIVHCLATNLMINFVVIYYLLQ